LRWLPVGVALLALVASVVPASAGTTGKLQGRVLGEKKEPLPGVNVRVEGQRLGAVTDEQGNYSIIAIPAGEYVVRANLIGYAAFAASKVQIRPDFTTDLNITLKSEAVQIEEV